jgi:WD40 repeat protein
VVFFSSSTSVSCSVSKYSNKLIDLLKYGNFKTIKKHVDYINHMRILPDGRLSSCSNDGTINIYNKENYKLEHKINVGDNVLYFNANSNGNIIACCEDGSLNIYELNNDKYDLINELKSHNDAVTKVINIENKLISCSKDTTMKIWEKKDNNYNNTKSIIIGYSYDNSNILQINENKLVSSSTDYITFFDIKNNFNEIKKIEDICSNSFCNSMTMFNENILIIGGLNSGIYLIDTNNYQVISELLQNDIFYSIIRLANGNILVGAYSSLIEYKYDNNNFIELKSKYIEDSDTITSLIEINDEVIISCSFDSSIKFFAF